jgi:hypothetical protein
MTYYIVAGYGSGGTMTPSGVVAVTGGTNKSFTIQANTNYHINTLTVDGAPVYPSLVNHVAYYVYTFYNVSADHTIQVTFSDSHFLTITHSAGGSVVPDDAHVVLYGETETVYFYPDDHMYVDYYIKNFVRSNFSQSSAPTSVTFTSVVSPQTLDVHFTQRVCYVYMPWSDVVDVSPRSANGYVAVDEGTSPTFTFTVNPNWTLVWVGIDGTPYEGITEYVFTHIMAGHTITFFCTFNGADNATMAGHGTSADPWIILDREDLENLGSNATTPIDGPSRGYLAEGQYYALGADIDLAGTNWIPFGIVGSNFSSFLGHLDGRGHYINNMTIGATGFSVGWDIGLFCEILSPTDGGVSIKNLHLCSATIEIGTGGGSEIGFLTGELHGATIENCSASGTINIEGALTSSVGDIGGLVGWIFDESVITDCRVDVVINIDVTGDDLWCIGGFAGTIQESIVSDCTCNCSMAGTFANAAAGQFYDVGGFVGYFDGSSLPKAVLSNVKTHCDMDFTIGELGTGALWAFGGVVGFSWYGVDIHDCSVSGRIKLVGTTSGNIDGAYYCEIGGFYGDIFGDSLAPITVDTIARCSSSVDLDLAGGYNTPDNWNGWNFEVGGFIGSAFIGETHFVDCYAIGDINIHDTAAISGVHDIGGFIGWGGDYLNHNYYAGDIAVPADALTVGGVCGDVGYATSPIDDANYWDTELSGIAVSARGTGKTTTEMQTQSTFTGWDFTTVWNIASESYPFLRRAFVTIRDWCKKASNAIWWVNK